MRVLTSVAKRGGETEIRMTATGAVPVPPTSWKPDGSGCSRPASSHDVVLTVSGSSASSCTTSGSREIAATVLKVVVAVGHLDGSHRRRSTCCSTWSTTGGRCSSRSIGFVIGVRHFLVLDGNRLLRELDPRPWAWAVIGGWPRVLRCSPLLGAVRATDRATAGSDWSRCGGSACSSPSPSTTASQPGLDWAKLLVCTGDRCGDRAGVGAAAPADAAAGASLASRSSAAASAG